MVDRNDFKGSLVRLFFVSAILLSILPYSIRGQDSKRIRLLITSDMHGWLSTSLVYPRAKRRGLLHIADTIRSARRDDPLSILIDAGDLLQGAPLLHFYHRDGKPGGVENPFFSLVRSLRYDAVVVGNHDLAINPLFERNYVPASNFSWLAANVHRNGKPVFQPYTLLKRNGLKIAVLGFTTPGSMMWLAPEYLNGIEIDSIEQAVGKWLKIVEKDVKPDLRIGVFHVGLNSFRDDENSKLNRIPDSNGFRKTIEGISGFDLAIFGHDHRLMPNRSGQYLDYIGKTPIVGGGHWAAALIDIELLLRKQNRVWRIVEIETKVKPASQNGKTDRGYLEVLSDDYTNYLYEELPWMFSATTRDQAGKCLNMLNALAQDGPDIVGTMFPKARIARLRRSIGKKIRRLDLLRWFPYDNRSVVIDVSLRDIYLLSHPTSEYGRKKVHRNRILFPWIKVPLNTVEKNTWWLDRGRFERKYRIKISDYHFQGGGGIIPRLFPDRNRTPDRSNEYLRDRLFDFLKSKENQLPQACGFLKYAGWPSGPKR
ncbi:MAG: bifunctional metallophosphatase/5'-nucleotidase [Proteobacteria bacterium]|nr:bifunctional metallophosphatase/5'-nucleotidase [Pseudomonadota bacterium]